MTMKKLSKTEFANIAGVSEKTVQRWCVQHRENLKKLFTPPKAKKLHPLAVKYLSQHYCVDLPLREAKKLE